MRWNKLYLTIFQEIRTVITERVLILVFLSRGPAHRPATIMRHTRTQLDFIENMAKERLRYETICAEQGEVLRSDPPKFNAAVVRICQSPLIAKCSQVWKPKEDDADQYLASCDDICQLVPQDFDELSFL